VLKNGEYVFQHVPNARLIETRRLPGEYVGGYGGVSVKLTKNVRYHTGGSRGTYVPGPEEPTPIDHGTVIITNKRVVFSGPRHPREWAFAKLLGVQHDPYLPWTVLPVSNRQKASGFLHDAALIHVVRYRLDLALAHYRGQVDELRTQLERAIAEHLAEEPPCP
jgi:hypothetical protein